MESIPFNPIHSQAPLNNVSEASVQVEVHTIRYLQRARLELLVDELSELPFFKTRLTSTQKSLNTRNGVSCLFVCLFVCLFYRPFQA